MYHKKDWTGNSASVFKGIGATNHADGERASMDYYATSPDAIDKLATKFDIPHKVWEPCCGEGALSQRLIELGHDVYSSDIVDRGYGDVMDFLSLEAYGHRNEFDCILTNPPYKQVTECILRALELLSDGGYACFFLKTTALEGRKRYEQIYRNTPPFLVLQFVDRILCAKNGDFVQAKKDGSAVSYAWFIWKKGFRGSTTIDWI